MKAKTIIPNLPAFVIQVTSNYKVKKVQSRSKASIAREKRMLKAKLEIHTGEDYRFFDIDWREYYHNEAWPDREIIRYKWSKRQKKYIKNKIFS